MPKGRPPKGKGGKTPKGKGGKTPKPKGKPNVPSFTMETWKNGVQRLVCRLSGRFCTIPDAMKQWKQQRAQNPKNRNPLANVKNPLQKNTKIAQKAQGLAGSNDPTKPDKKNPLTTNNQPPQNTKGQGKTPPPQGNTRGGQTTTPQGNTKGGQTPPPQGNKGATNPPGANDPTVIEANKSSQPSANHNPGSSPSRGGNRKNINPDNFSQEGRARRFYQTNRQIEQELGLAKKAATEKKASSTGKGSNPSTPTNTGQGVKASTTPQKPRVGPNADTLILNKNQTPATSNVRPANIQFKPTEDPTRVIARGKAREMKQQFGYKLSQKEVRDIAQWRAEELRQKFFQAKQNPKKTPTPPPATGGNSSDFISKVGKVINQRTQPGRTQPVADFGRRLQGTGQALGNKGKKVLQSTGQAIGEAGNKTRKVIQGVGAGLFTAMQNATKNKQHPPSPTPPKGQNLLGQPPAKPKVPDSPLPPFNWRTNPFTSRGIQPPPDTVTKKLKKGAGEVVDKGIDVLTNPFVQLGAEAYFARDHVQELKKKGAGPFETYMNVGGRMVGAVTEELIVPRWTPRAVRLLPLGEELGGAVAGTAGKVIDKSGAGKVIIDTTTQTAKALDKKFPGAPPIDIPKKRTRPTFRQMTGEE